MLQRGRIGYCQVMPNAELTSLQQREEDYDK